MRELSIIAFTTLDGVMQSPSSPDEDASGGFKNGGWAGPYWEGVMEQVKTEAMAQPYDILFGRKTYDIFASHFPEVGDANPVSAMMNAARKYVVTSDASSLGWRNTEAIQGDIYSEIRALKAGKGPMIQVHGSPQLVRFLHDHKLIDEYRLWVFPVVAGPGKRLFSEAVFDALTLKKSAPTGNGAIMAVYRRA